MARHVNIPIFIPHEGCNNSCVFCNQRTITGRQNMSDEQIPSIIDAHLKTVSSADEVEIAFFGGSFTGIGIERMTRLCEMAGTYVEKGLVKSIRLSTRPDYIDSEILAILKKNHVTHIELGIQSMNDDVLRLNKRGHTADDTRRACKMIVDKGFILGGQMMIGLCGSTAEDEAYTAKEIVKMGAKEARIYPTVVFYSTELCDMAQRGDYSPLLLDEAVERSGKAYEIFENAGINVLRIGLQESENLHDGSLVYGGASHPSMGELVRSRYFYEKICSRLDEIINLRQNGKTRLIIYCAEKNVSQIVGQKKCNIEKLLSILKNHSFCEIKVIGCDGLDDKKVFFSSESIQEKQKRRKNQCT